MRSLAVQVIAEHVQGKVVGDPEAVVTHPCGLQDAGPGALSFLSNPKYASHLDSTKATAVIVGPDITQAPCTLIQVENPDLAFSQAVSFMVGPPPQPQPGVSPDATVAPSATLEAGVTIGARSVIEADVSIGANSILYPGVVVGHGAQIGAGCILYPGAVLYHDVVLGAGVIVHANAVIGSDGFGYVFDGRQHVKIPQVGTVELGDGVEIGAGVTIDRARFGVTRIGPGTKIDNQVQIAHNVEIGACSILVAQVGISGSTKLGNGVIAGGQVGFAGHLTVGDGAKFTAQTGVNKNIPAGEHFSGTPAMPHRAWLDGLRSLKALPRLRKTVKELEKKIEALENEPTDNRP